MIEIIGMTQGIVIRWSFGLLYGIITFSVLNINDLAYVVLFLRNLIMFRVVVIFVDVRLVMLSWYFNFVLVYQLILTTMLIDPLFLYLPIPS
jgi:hypothetical protein